MQFLLVSIREAHASDAWQMSSNERDGVVHATPKNLAERCELAETCVAGLKVDFPTLVDGFDDATDEAYHGWPERLCLVDTDGRIRFLSAPGPFGFDPDALATALAALPAR